MKHSSRFFQGFGNDVEWFPEIGTESFNRIYKYQDLGYQNFGSEFQLFCDKYILVNHNISFYGFENDHNIASEVAFCSCGSKITLSNSGVPKTWFQIPTSFANVFKRLWMQCLRFPKWTWLMSDWWLYKCFWNKLDLSFQHFGNDLNDAPKVGIRSFGLEITKINIRDVGKILVLFSYSFKMNMENISNIFKTTLNDAQIFFLF